MKTGAVAFLDILGFKGIWQKRRPEEILKLLHGVSDVVIKSYRHPPPESHWPASSPPVVTTLSDTVVIAIDSENEACILLLANVLYTVIQHFYKEQLFVRGALAWGKYLQEQTTFIGPAIDDVAAWYEQADWIGVIATPKASYALDWIAATGVGVNNFTVEQFVKYDVPGKDRASYRLNAFNWPGYLQASFGEMPGVGKTKARSTMEGLFSKQDAFDASVLRKYENTLKFVDHALAFMRPINSEPAS